MQGDPSRTDAAAAGPGQASADRRVADAVRLGLIGLFAYWSLTLVAPFAVVMIWAIIFAVALYPLYASLRARLGGRGGLAATLITLVGLVIIIGPLAAITLNFADAVQPVITELRGEP